jgi:PAS domain S-box-containing protein
MSKQEPTDYRKLYNSMLAGLGTVDVVYFGFEVVYDEGGKPVDLIFTQVDPATERLMGKSKAELIGKSRKQIFGDTPDDFPSRFDAVLKTGQSTRFQTFGPGLRKYYDVYAWKINDREVAGFLVDLTERKKAEEALESSYKQINDIVESIQEYFYTIDRNWNFTYVNKKAADLLGYEPNALVGKNIWKIFPRVKGTVFEENYLG